jgi:hypothetical protein
MTNTDAEAKIISRLEQLGLWLEEQAPYAQSDQRHLDGGSPEQVYWHMGYRCGLKDVLRLLETINSGKLDIPNRCREDDQDA